MTIFVSAGHTPSGLNQDPGAIGNGYEEADLTKELRDLVVPLLKQKGLSVWVDNDTQRLPAVLAAINSTEKDVVCDIHFNAGSPTATGVEVLIPTRHTAVEREMANKLVTMLAGVMKIRSRGVKTELDSQHKSIGILREQGINLLIEVCFISNKTDMQFYQASKNRVAEEIALILEEAEGKL
jgi:N-acetylmuramoyl-L-alanine amidase